jgi:heme/copper-type cytochrome/quinol oxidase subunit 2
VVVILFVWGGLWLTERKQLDGFWFVATAIFIFIGVLYAMFSSEFDYFSEKKKNEESTKSEPS